MTKEKFKEIIYELRNSKWIYAMAHLAIFIMIISKIIMKDKNLSIVTITAGALVFLYGFLSMPTKKRNPIPIRVLWDYKVEHAYITLVTISIMAFLNIVIRMINWNFVVEICMAIIASIALIVEIIMIAKVPRKCKEDDEIEDKNDIYIK